MTCGQVSGLSGCMRSVPDRPNRVKENSASLSARWVTETLPTGASSPVGINPSSVGV